MKIWKYEEINILNIATEFLDIETEYTERVFYICDI